MPPDRETSSEAEKTHPSDVLMDAARQPEEFSRVLANWLAREHSWRDARLRFFGLLAKQNYYDLDGRSAPRTCLTFFQPRPCLRGYSCRMN